MLTRVIIKNFRSLHDIMLTFETASTVIVGENDSGKSAIFHAILAATGKREVDVNDFTVTPDDSKEYIFISLKFSDFTLDAHFSRGSNDNVDTKRVIRYSNDFVNNIAIYLDSDEYISLGNAEKKFFLRENIKLLGGKAGGNASLSTLHDKLKELIAEYLSTPQDIEISNAPVDIVYLDGRSFHDITNFIFQMALQERLSDVWYIDTEQGNLSDLIQDNVDKLIAEAKSKILDTGVVEKIAMYLPNVNDIELDAKLPSLPRINPLLSVLFVDASGSKIDIDKMGDGTKRRVTLALLEANATIASERERVYIFDEPDTHLHAKAQLQLLNILYQFTESGAQVLLSTHSPFIINATKPQQIYLLKKKDNHSIVSKLTSASASASLMSVLGVANVDILFSRVFLLVEGQTEEIFIHILFDKLCGTSIQSRFIRVMRRPGNTDIPRFAEILSDIVRPEIIYILTDNDASAELENLINALSIPSENVFL